MGLIGLIQFGQFGNTRNLGVRLAKMPFFAQDLS
jgi:hypothetical protein